MDDFLPILQIGPKLIIGEKHVKINLVVDIYL